MTVLFCNNGNLDIRALTTFGVSVKNENAIGYFGTGFKFALATLLRNGQSIKVFAGDSTYSFEAKPAIIRGEHFDLIHMTINGRKKQDIGLTTQAGRNWTLKQAYRELYSNCMDEGGEVFFKRTSNPPSDYQVCVMVKGEEFDQTHHDRDEIILHTQAKKRLFHNEDLEIYSGGSSTLWYRGIAAYNLDKPGHFTYNILRRMELTEDRTLADIWTARAMIRDAILETEAKDIIYPSIIGDKTMESRLDWQYTYHKPNAVFKETVRAIRENPAAQVADSALTLFYKHTEEVSDVFKIVTLTAEQLLYFNRALDKLRSSGIVPGIDKYEFVFVEKLARQSGEAFAGKIIVNAAVCCADSRELIATILEEYMHLELKVQDHTRQMQNALFDMITQLLNRT